MSTKSIHSCSFTKTVVVQANRLSESALDRARVFALRALGARVISRTDVTRGTRPTRPKPSRRPPRARCVSDAGLRRKQCVRASRKEPEGEEPSACSVHTQAKRQIRSEGKRRRACKSGNKWR